MYAIRSYYAQLGSLGSGNHFLEVQYVDELFDENAAKVYGVEKDQVVLMIHTGSRGLGHQICADYLRYMESASKKYNIKLPDSVITSYSIHYTKLYDDFYYVFILCLKRA